MAQIEKTFQVEKLEAKVKIIEEKEEGQVIDRHIMTEVKVEYEGTPAELDKVLYALKGGHLVNMTLATPQLGLDESEVEKKEPVAAMP